MSTMTTSRPAQHSGTFLIGGELPVVRLGFGAMRLTGPGIWESLQILVRPLPHPRCRWPAAAHPDSARRRRPGWHAPGTASRAVRSASHSHTSPADVPATRYAPSFFASPPQDVAYFADFHDSRDFGVQLRPNLAALIQRRLRYGTTRSSPRGLRLVDRPRSAGELTPASW